MKTNVTQTDQPNLTIGDLCEALADGRLASHRDSEYYVVRKQDFRRFVQLAEIKQLQTTPNLLDRFFAAS